MSNNIPIYGFENKHYVKDARWLASKGVGTISVVLDLVETGSFFVPAAPEISAAVDILAAGAGSVLQGETYYGQPHPDLPVMAVLGQDVIVASAEGAIGTIGKWGLTLAGAEIGGFPGGATAGYVAGTILDMGTSLTQASVDAARLFGVFPTVVSVGAYLESIWPLPPKPRLAFMFYQPEFLRNMH